MTSDFISFFLLLIADLYVILYWHCLELSKGTDKCADSELGVVSQGTSREETCSRLGGGLDSLVNAKGKDSNICRQLY